MFAVPGVSLSLPLFPFIRGEVLPATFSLPHLLFFSTLLSLLSSSSSLPPLLSSSRLSLHSPPISVLASLASSCPFSPLLIIMLVTFQSLSFACISLASSGLILRLLTLLHVLRSAHIVVIPTFHMTIVTKPSRP